MAQGKPDAGPWNPSTPLNPTPILRDTVTVNEDSHLVIRFVASNRGVWIFHCEPRRGEPDEAEHAAGLWYQQCGGNQQFGVRLSLHEQWVQHVPGFCVRPQSC